jgi:hypothetical protein
MQKLRTCRFLRFARCTQGSALVTVVVFSIIFGISGAAYLTLTSTSVNRETAGLLDARAFAAAESGLLMGTQWLIKQDNWTAQDQSDILGSALRGANAINGIDIRVDVEEDGGTISIVSTASHEAMRYDKHLRWEVLVAEGTPLDPPAFDFTMMSEGDMTAVGNVTVAPNDPTGNSRGAHTNGSFAKSGASGSLEFDLSAVGSISDRHETIQGTTTPGADAVAFPDIGLADWEDAADHVVENPQDAEDLPTSGIIWVNADADVVLEDYTLNGTLIVNLPADASLTIEGGCDISNEGDLALGCLSGNILIRGNADVHGLVYAMQNGGEGGDIDIGGTPTLTGQAIAQGKMWLRGTPDVFLYERTDPITTPGQANGGVTLVPGTWRETNTPL